MSQNNYDVIVVGSGSLGTPTALYLAEAGLKTLVIDSLDSNGQASNKHAIGGIRATHSDPAKIHLCTDSIKVFSNWEAEHGDDIEWRSGGYSFVAYDDEIEKSLKDLLSVQKAAGLNIDWKTPDELLKVAKGLNTEGLRGGTLSPEDGYASPLKANYAFYAEAKRHGADFHFRESITGVSANSHRVEGIRTNKAEYSCKWLINAAGGWAAEVSDLAGVTVPVRPDLHEALVTEPVQQFMLPMIVDIRKRPGSSNFYFYQTENGQIIACQTPSPQIWGTSEIESSEFLPQISRRLLEVMPKMRNLRVRRTWRGSYPMTPDGSPILGEVADLEGYLLAVGACGQGFMLGPGVGQLMTRLITGSLTELDRETLDELRLDRGFEREEKLG